MTPHAPFDAVGVVPGRRPMTATSRLDGAGGVHAVADDAVVAARHQVAVALAGAGVSGGSR